MTTIAPADSAKRPRRWGKYLLALVAIAFVCVASLLFYTTTDSFQSLVRRRLVAEVERITGGRAQIGSLHTIPFRLQFEVRDITVHGRESATDVPLAHADGIVARLKITSLLRSELAFEELVLDQPVIHLAFYPDGTTNFPKRSSTITGPTSIEQLFALSIDRLELRHGHLIWDDQTIPLDLAARDTWLQMDYSYLHASYHGRLLLGLVDTKLLDCRPFAWMSSADFTLGSDSADVTSLKWNSGHSNLFATGHITNFRRPHIQATYEAHLDLTEAASISRRPDLRSGLLDLKGEGNWSIDQFASEGFVALRDVAFQNDQISFSKAALTSGYSVTDQQLKLSKIQGRIFSGTVTGDADLNQWLAPDQHVSAAVRKSLETATISAAPLSAKPRQPISKPRPTAIQSALIVLRLRDISAEELALALNARAHPLVDFHLSSLASGTVETRWKGTRRDTEIQFALDSAPPPHPTQRPLTVHSTGIYYAATDTLDLPQFNLTTPTSHVQASGNLSASSSLHLSVSTSSLIDWLPFVAAVRGPALFPVVLNGRATFNGNLTGEFSSPQLAGNLQVDDFDVNIPATANTHPLETHWDSLSTSLQLSFESIALHSATLRRDDTSAVFDASATLVHGHFIPESEFTIRANVQNADLAAVQALAGYNYPITGTGNFFLQAAGTEIDAHGDGKVHLNQATAYGEPIRQFDSDFHFAHGELAFDNIHLFHDDSVFTGSAAYNPTTRAFRLDVSGSNLDLARIRQIPPNRLALEGRADLTLKASGTPDAPIIDSDIHIRNLTLDHELEGDLDLQATTRGDTLQLTGNSHLQRGSLQIGGNIQLRDGYPSDLSFRMDQFDLDSFWHAYLGAQLTGHSAVAGSLHLLGPLFHASRWTVDGDLSSVSLDLEHVKLHNQDPVRFALANQAINIQQLHMLGEGTDLTAHGGVQLSGARTLDLAADGRLDLKLLTGFDPDLTASGLVTMNMTVGGSLSDPFPQGRLQFTNGSLSYATLPSGLSELNGSLVFTREHVHVETLTARTGGGTLALQGDATYLNQQLNFNLTATGKDVRLRYPPGVSSTADATLHWVGTRSASTVSGEISVNKIAVTPGFDFSSYLERGRQGSPITIANSPLNNIKLDIHVQTAPELQMRTAIARLSGDADLRVRGSVARPAVLGRVDVLEGQATFHGTRYTLDRGDITFTNPVSVDPQLNLQASTHVRNYDLNITVTGSPDRGLNINYRSEPPLPKSDIIALLALGRTGDESSQLQQQSGQTAFTDQATALILSQALNTTVSSRFQRLFGASNIKIDPQGLTTETNPISNGPQITIEQEFANNISLTYSTNVSQSSQQIIQGEYYFNRNLSVVGTRDQNGVVSFDVRVRRRKK
ncbi:MAG TPA: translocation/assembly module TamB domain-containing protein [Candidatus Sulfotelmatobacter sp.]|jgi:translocation and assembly module TamB|nr:translocation/assembly module TamB domain-containing protein [Candidatus Sulfotelmatobacter sp.]